MPPSRRYRSSLRARTTFVAIVTLVLAVAGTAVGALAAEATPNFQPRINQVTALLDRLSKQNDMLDERYNAAVAAVAAQRRVAQAAQRDAQAAAHASALAHERFIEALTEQYEAGKMSSTGALLTSPNPQSYLDSLSTMSYLSGQFASTIKTAETARARARSASAHAAQELAAARSKAQDLLRQRATLVARTQKFKNLLATLNQRQREAYARARSIAAAKARAAAAARARAAAAAQARRDQAAAAQQNHHATAPAPQPQRTHHAPPPTSGSAVQRVVDFAIAQVGKPYVFAASGPNAFDCSGLTMAAWAQAGISLPHLAAAQYNVGQRVSYSQLEPGDLIFLYQPIGHVEIYVGHDLAVSAADEALGIVYVHPSQDMADFAGASRPDA